MTQPNTPRHEVRRETQPQLPRGKTTWKSPFTEQLERCFCYFYWFGNTRQNLNCPKRLGRSRRVKMRRRNADGEEGEALSTTGLHLTKPKHRAHGKNSHFSGVLKGCSCICQIQAHTRPGYFHKPGMTQSHVLLLPILVPTWAPRVPLGVTKSISPVWPQIQQDETHPFEGDY